MVLAHVDGGVVGDGLQQRALDFSTRQVLGVHDPPAGVPPFPTQRELAVPVPGELRTPFHELSHSVRAFVHQLPHRVFVAQASPGLERVSNVELGTVGAAHDRGNAALGVVRVGFRPLLLGHHGDARVVSELESECEPGDPRADHQHVGRMFVHGDISSRA